MENNANQLNSMLCKKNCGFFGNAAYDGYCSKCYKDHVKRQNSGSAAGRVTPTDVNNSNSQQVQSSNNLVTIGSTNSNQLNNTNNSSTAPIPIPNRINSNINFKEDPSNIISMNTDSTQIDSSNVSNQCNPIASSCTSDASSSLTSTSLTSSSVGSEKKKRTRCCVDSCKRKVGLTGFDCRCGGLFCWEHRYSDKHDCKFDYKELGQDQIRKNNPIVVGEKIQKI